MSILQIACLTIFAAGMALGQFLFKSAAQGIGASGSSSFADQASHLFKLALDPLFLLAMVLYLGLSLFWTWILTFTPLSRAYPFGALAIVFTLIAGVVLFRESIGPLHLAGSAFILIGIVMLAQA